MCQAPIWVFCVYDFIPSSQSLSAEDTLVIVLNLYIGKLRHPAVVELAWIHIAGEGQSQYLEAGSLTP